MFGGEHKQTDIAQSAIFTTGSMRASRFYPAILFAFLVMYGDYSFDLSSKIRIASSYIFDLKPGDKVTISGPYGDFFIKDTEREMVYIGGGAGMAPLRSHIFHLFHTLKTGRKVSYWYGARSKREMFYDDHFKKIQDQFSNFEYHVALSDPMPEDNWTGFTGFIHQVVHENYLKDHEDPTEIEYYMCGPPMMNTAVTKMLEDLGVEEDMIDYDDFGG